MNVLDVCGLQCASYGRLDAADAETTTILNTDQSLYRKLVWREDQLVGAIFAGRASDVGMLGDMGMTKGLLQTRAKMGIWKQYLVDHPFDIRRVFVALGIASRLSGTTLLGQPAVARARYAAAAHPADSSLGNHRLFLETRSKSS
jgi:hypothetical protein